MQRLLALATIAAAAMLGVLAPSCGGKATAPPTLASNDVDAAWSGSLDAGMAPLSPDAAIPGISRNGWTWSNVGPQANDLFGVWGSAPGDVWFVGAAGTVLHYGGSTFTAPDSATGVDLRAVSGSAPDDVWAAGFPDDGPTEIIHWDGAQWTRVAVEDGIKLLGLAAPSKADAWAVGYRETPTGGQGVILHWDGGTWSTVTLPGAPPRELDGVWASGPGDVWVAGSYDPSFDEEDGLAALHYDGSTWSDIASPDGGANGVGSLVGVWESTAGDVWFAGQIQVDRTQPGEDPSGYLMRYSSPGGWSAPYVFPSYATPLFALTGSPSGAVTAVGSAGAALRWDGSTWNADEPLPGDYRAIWSAPADAWAVGLGGVMAHWDGTHWTQLVPPPPTYGYYFAAGVWAGSKTDAWVAGNGPINAMFSHWDGNAWTQSSVDETSSAYAYLFGIFGTGPNDVWAVGGSNSGGTGPAEPDSTGRAIHWDGSSWQDEYDLPSSVWLRSVWESGPADVWVTTEGNELAHFDGSSWSLVPFGMEDNVLAVTGTGPADVWASTEYGGDAVTIHHWDGRNWTVAYSGSGFVTALWATDAQHAWAVGWSGTILTWDGHAWTAASSGTTYDLSSVWASGPNDVWAVGTGGAVVHSNGSAWTSSSVTSTDLIGVAGSGPDDVWMVTRWGAILHHP
jgi:hypothetical protein